MLAAVVFAINDVIDLETKPGIVLVNQTVLATVFRALRDFIAKRVAYVTAHW
jgi:hypothetical protein